MELHRILGQIPLVGLTAALLLLAWGLLRRRAGLVAIGLLSIVIVAVLAVPLFFAGRSAGARAGMAGVSPATIGEHESAAIGAIVGLFASASVAVTGLFAWWERKRIPTFAAAATLVLGLAAAALVVRAAGLGSVVRDSVDRIESPRARSSQSPP